MKAEKTTIELVFPPSWEITESTDRGYPENIIRIPVKVFPGEIWSKAMMEYLAQAETPEAVIEDMVEDFMKRLATQEALTHIVPRRRRPNANV